VLTGSRGGADFVYELLIEYEDIFLSWLLPISVLRYLPEGAILWGQSILHNDEKVNSFQNVELSSYSGIEVWDESIFVY
jgi:hypothetical protein